MNVQWFNRSEYAPFPLTVTGVMARFCTVAVGVAATDAARAAAMATVFIVTACVGVMIITVD